MFHSFVPAETFMSDGGKHFDNNEVRDLCRKWGTTIHIVPAYSPWINGLVEGANKILLHVLKRLCAPNLGADEDTTAKLEDTPRNWPEHLDEAIRIINSRLLPALGFSPKELLFGLVINTPPTEPSASLEPVTAIDATTQMAYVAQQRLDGYAEMVAHAIKRKTVFDKRVLAHKPSEVIFSKGQLVQIYRSDLDFTFKTERKMLPKWSTPQRVTTRNLNSYTLERLDGTPIAGQFSARRLRKFTPKEGTALAAEQTEVEERVRVESQVEDEASTRRNDDAPVGEVQDRDQVDEESSRGTMNLGDEDAATREGGHME